MGWHYIGKTRVPAPTINDLRRKIDENSSDFLRVAEVRLTERFRREIPSEGHGPSASANLEGSTAWRDTAYFAGGKRAFGEYVVLDAALWIGEDGRPGLSHAGAIARLKATGRARDRADE